MDQITDEDFEEQPVSGLTLRCYAITKQLVPIDLLDQVSTVVRHPELSEG